MCFAMFLLYTYLFIFLKNDIIKEGIINGGDKNVKLNQ